MDTEEIKELLDKLEKRGGVLDKAEWLISIGKFEKAKELLNSSDENALVLIEAIEANEEGGENTWRDKEAIKMEGFLKTIWTNEDAFKSHIKAHDVLDLFDVEQMERLLAEIKLANIMAEECMERLRGERAAWKMIVNCLNKAKACRITVGQAYEDLTGSMVGEKMRNAAKERAGASKDKDAPE